MNIIFKNEVFKQLRAAGYYEAELSEDENSIIPTPEFPSLQIKEKHVQMSLDSSMEERSLGHGIMTDIKLIAQEVQALWENSIEMPADSGVEDNFHKLSEFGEIVFAARDDGHEGLYFTTWQYGSPSHDYVQWGHYTYDFNEAKEDFATRSGLIDKNRLLIGLPEAPIIEHALDYLVSNVELPDEVENQIIAIRQTLDSLDPGIEQNANALWELHGLSSMDELHC